MPDKSTGKIDLPNHEDAKDLIKGALVNYLGMIAKISKVIFVLVAARIYGPTALGLYLLAWSVIDIASKFGLWGFDRNLIRDIARFNIDDAQETRAKIFGILRFNISIALGLSMLAAGIVFILSDTIALKIFKDTNLVTPVKILSIALPFAVLTNLFLAATKALRTMKYDVLIRQTLEPLVLLLATLALIPLSLGAVGLVTAHILASFVAAIGAAFVVFRKYRHLGWQSEPLPAAIKKETIRYIAPMGLMEFLGLAAARLDIMLIGALLNSTSAGFYGIAVEIISIIKRVRQGFEPIFSTIVSELFYNQHKTRLQRNYVVVTRWLLGGSLLPFLVIVLYPAQLLVLFNKEAVIAASALMVLALSHSLLSTFIGSETLLIMTGKTFLNTVLVAAMLAINGVVSVALIPKLGITGAAVGMLSAYAFLSMARLFYGYRHYKLHPFGNALLWPLITAAVTATVFSVVNFWLHVDSLAETIAIVIAVVIFYAGVYFLRATEAEEKHLIQKIMSKLRTPAIIRT